LLPEALLEPLRRSGYEPQVSAEGGMICVLIPGYRLPEGYLPAMTDLLLRLPAGFPEVPPDMFWVDPPVAFARTGAAPAATELRETHLGRVWQRFSRHLAPGSWRPGCDSLQSYLSLLHTDLARDAAAHG